MTGLMRSGAVALCVAGVMAATAATGLGATKSKTISSGVVDRNVAPGASVVQTLNFKKKGKVKDVNVGVALTTNQNSDFAFLLQSPKGKVVHLSSGNGGSGNGYGGGCSADAITTFDDEAPLDIQDYEGIDHVFTGASFIPEQFDDFFGIPGLATFDGSNPVGKWRLIAVHTEDIGSGTLRCAKVKVKYKPASTHGH